jgi:ADP-ribose pyrophosphatase YjhB (NUDIX family)
MNVLAPIEPDEVERLSRRYGAPRRVVQTLAESSNPRGKEGDQRRGEVVMAIRMQSGKVLLHTKRFYPLGVFRLPSGGIHRDEAVEDALFREVQEETGLQVNVEKFVAVVEYERNQQRDAFASYVFLLRTHERRATAQDEQERIAAFKTVTADGLKAAARRLRHLPSDWRQWGEYRAVAHDLVADAMA